MEEVEVVVFFLVFYCCASVVFTSMLQKRMACVEKEIEHAAMTRAEKRRGLLLRIRELDLELAQAEVRHHRRRRILRYLRARHSPVSVWIRSRVRRAAAENGT